MKKYLYIAIIAVLLGIIGFQVYFDQQIRITNGKFLAHITLIENFINTQLPEQVANFNKGQTNPPK